MKGALESRGLVVTATWECGNMLHISLQQHFFLIKIDVFFNHVVFFLFKKTPAKTDSHVGIHHILWKYHREWTLDDKHPQKPYHPCLRDSPWFSHDFPMKTCIFLGFHIIFLHLFDDFSPCPMAFDPGFTQRAWPWKLWKLQDVLASHQGDLEMGKIYEVYHGIMGFSSDL